MEKSRGYTFVGLSENSRAYRYYSPDTNTVLTSRNVIFEITPKPRFIEGILPDTAGAPLKGDTPGPEVVPEAAAGIPERETPDNTREAETAAEQAAPPPGIPDDGLAEPKKSEEAPDHSVTPEEGPRRSSRQAEKPRLDYRKLNDPSSHSSIKGTPKDTASHAVDYAYVQSDDPQTVKEAKDRSDWPKWKEAMDSEMEQLARLETYTLIQCPPERRPVGCKWVFHLKRDHLGNIARYKARLVAQGFSQIPGVDFSETYSPVVRMESVRNVLVIGVAGDLNINTYDADCAYLNGILKETIFMRQPPGYEDGTDRVCRLGKTLYGLKQSGREWHEKLDGSFTKEGFDHLDADRCVYVRQQGERLAITPVHVDDMLMTATPGEEEVVKAELGRHFKIKDLGPTKQFLGMEIARDRPQGTLKVMQVGQVKRALTRFGMEDATPVGTPLDSNIKLLKAPGDEEVDRVLQAEYQSLIGSIMYIALGTRPDIAFAVQHLSQFSSNPMPDHLTAAKQVLRYLKGTADVGLQYGPNTLDNLQLVGYTDADWAGDANDRKSVSGFVFLLGGNIISWGAKKQPTVALSSMEAEYMALSHATREAIWLRNELGELGIVQDGPTPVYVDNQGTIAFSKLQDFHGRSKHIDVRHHFVRECIARGDIEVSYVPTAENLADIFTKALPRERFVILRTLLRL